MQPVGNKLVQGPEMSCVSCTTCEEQLDRNTGMPTGRCVYGGPYTGFERAQPIDEAVYIRLKYPGVNAVSWDEYLKMLKEKKS